MTFKVAAFKKLPRWKVVGKTKKKKEEEKEKRAGEKKSNVFRLLENTNKKKMADRIWSLMALHLFFPLFSLLG